MTNCHDVREQLSPLMDGQLSEADRAVIEAHLDVCEACRGLRQDLQRLERAAASLGPIAPPDHVWLQVAGQVRMEPRAAGAMPQSSHPRAALGQWVGLAAALVLVTVGAYYFLRATPPPEAPGNARASGTVEAIAEELSLASQHYERAIAELEALAEADSSALDPAMTDTLRQNIRTINAAIDESRAALSENPGSEPARESLFEALRRKVVVLQATVNLMNEMRKGNQAGAVEAAAAFSKKS
jgi:hypothetical protein